MHSLTLLDFLKVKEIKECFMFYVLRFMFMFYVLCFIHLYDHIYMQQFRCSKLPLDTIIALTLLDFLEFKEVKDGTCTH